MLVLKVGLKTGGIVLSVSIALGLLLGAHVTLNAQVPMQTAFYTVCVKDSEKVKVTGWPWSASQLESGLIISGMTDLENGCAYGNFEPGTWTFEAGDAVAITPATKVVEGGSIASFEFVYDADPSKIGSVFVQVKDQFGNPSPRVSVAITSASGVVFNDFTQLGEYQTQLSHGNATVQVEGFESRVVNISSEPQIVSFQRNFTLPGNEWLLVHYRGIKSTHKQQYGIYVDLQLLHPSNWDCRVYYPGSQEGEVGGCVSTKEEAHLIVLEPGSQEVQLVAKRQETGDTIVVTKTVEVPETAWMLFSETGKVTTETVEFQFWLDETVMPADGVSCTLKIFELNTTATADPCPTTPNGKLILSFPFGDHSVEVKVFGEQESHFYIVVPVLREQQEEAALFLPQLTRPLN